MLIHHRHFFTLTLVTLAAATTGCSGPGDRFSTVTDGSYACQAKVTANTCGVTVGSSMMASDVLEGGGTDTISLVAPDEGSLFEANIGWSTVQFGAQSDPDTYQISGSAGCSGASFTANDQLTSFGTGKLAMTITYQYAGLKGCTAPSFTMDTCTLSYEVTCGVAP